MGTHDYARKAGELRAARCVASVRGGKVVPETGEWPDAWIEDGAERLPVEVVTMYERTGEDAVRTYPPAKGSRAAMAMAVAEREAQRRGRAGDPPPLYGQVSGQPFVGDVRLPLPAGPLHTAEWAFTAVRQKEAKRYGDVAQTVLVVELCDCPWFGGCEAADVRRLLEGSGCAFREVWVVFREDWVSSTGETSQPRRVWPAIRKAGGLVGRHRANTPFEFPIFSDPRDRRER